MINDLTLRMPQHISLEHALFCHACNRCLYITSVKESELKTMSNKG